MAKMGQIDRQTQWRETINEPYTRNLHEATHKARAGITRSVNKHILICNLSFHSDYLMHALIIKHIKSILSYINSN